MGEKFAADLARSGTLAPERVSTATRARNQRFLDAPVLVLALVDTSVLDAYDDRERMAAEMTMGVQSVAAALQTMLLALHVTGLAACWYCAPLFADRIVHDVLGVPQAWHAQAFIATGLPAGNTAIDRRLDGRMGGTERRALEEIAFDPWYFQAGGRGEGGGERP